MNMEEKAGKWVMNVRFMRKHYLLAFWFAGAVFLLGLITPCWSEIVDYIVAVVNGEPVTLSMVEQAMNAIWTDPQNAPRSQQAALQRLIDHKLKLQEARRLGTDVIADVIVSEERLSRELAKVFARFPDPKRASDMLNQQGISQEDLEERLIEEIMIQEMVNRKFRLFVEVTDIEASAFFEQNKEQFMLPETVRLEQIFFQLAPDADGAAKDAVKAEVEKVLKKLRGGDDFSEYASADGIVDYVPVEQLVPVVAATVARLEVGEISELIETPAGYFIIRLSDRRSARQATFGEVKTEIRELLVQQKTDAELSVWLKEQREAVDIRFMVRLDGG
jgi:parvulin-like peptidyl-prolyl isomerase